MSEHNDPPPTTSSLRFLVVAYEFADPIFSGNGTYGRTVVEALCLAHLAGNKGVTIQVDSVMVDVLTAVPVLSTAAALPSTPVPFSSCVVECGQVNLLQVPVPAEAWRRHDWESAWRSFAYGAAGRYGPSIRERVAPSGGGSSAYDAVVAVDWHGLVALQEVLGGWDALRRVGLTTRTRAARPLMFLNFRVFGNPALAQSDAEALAAFRAVESIGVLCCRTVALCRADAVMLQEHATKALRLRKVASTIAPQQPITDSSTIAHVAQCATDALHHFSPDPQQLPALPDVVLPPVRSEVIAFASNMDKDEVCFVNEHLPQDVINALRQTETNLGSPTTDKDVLERRLLVCCVRQARDKNPDRFVSLIEDVHAACEGTLVNRRTGLPYIPVVFGATPDPAFSQELRERLLRVCPNAVWLSAFITPPQLVAIFRVTALNVHPSLYDAYGLTVVEAAVCRCPTLLHKEPMSVCSPVGVVDLLMPPAAASTTPSSITTGASSAPPADCPNAADTNGTVVFADLRDDAHCRARTTDAVVSLLECSASVEPAIRCNDHLTSVAERACLIARQYDTAACGALLSTHLFSTRDVVNHNC